MTTLIGIDKLESANPMNAIDEIKCDMCKHPIFQEELYMICHLKTYQERVIRNFCCDCFQEKVENDISRIQNWSTKNINRLLDMLIPIESYLESDSKKEIDINRKMILRIEGEDNGELKEQEFIS